MVPRHGRPVHPPAPDPATFRRALHAWYRKSHRLLPWRETRDPYAIWVSEVMLQQTRVESVMGYYSEFLERFPDAGALAAADEPAVLAAWSGLGYYRRARFLRSAARVVVREHRGRFPRELEQAMALPGIGRSTAGAILSIAYGLAHPVLDGNVARVLQRLAARPGVPDMAPAQLWELATRLMPPRSGAALHTQAMMELGATTCLPDSPACPRCPVKKLCGAHAFHLTADVPAPRKRPRQVREEECVGIISVRDGLVLERRAGPGALHGMVGLPRAASREELQSSLGTAARLVEQLPGLTHFIMNRRIATEVWRGTIASRSRLRGELFVVARKEVFGQPLDGTSRKLLKRHAS